MSVKEETSSPLQRVSATPPREFFSIVVRIARLSRVGDILRLVVKLDGTSARHPDEMVQFKGDIRVVEGGKSCGR